MQTVLKIDGDASLGSFVHNGGATVDVRVIGAQLLVTGDADDLERLAAECLAAANAARAAL